MAYIKERGENTYLVRITIGTDGHGKPVQKSRTFHPSKSNLPKTKLKKELDAFVEAFESEFQNTMISYIVIGIVCNTELAVEPCQQNLKCVNLRIIEVFVDTEKVLEKTDML